MNYFKKYTFTEWLLLGIIIGMNSPWLLWGYDLGGPVMYLCVITVLFIFFKRKRFHSTNGALGFVLLILYFILFQIPYDIHITYILITLFYLVVLNLTYTENKNVLNLTTNYVFWSIIIPLPLWLVHQFIVPLPVIGYIDQSSFKGLLDEQICENHFFFVSVRGLDAMRFYSWYDEPGVLGTLASFILWGNKYNLRDYRNIIIIIGGIFTFSLAFYVLSAAGFMYYGFKSTKKAIVTFVIIISFGFLSYILLKDNIAFQASIVERVVNFDEYGIDSRTGGYDIDGLWKRARQKNNLLLGLGSGAMNEQGGITKTYKTFIIEFGYFGLLILVISYLFLIKKMKFRALFTLVLFLAAFMQRPQMLSVYELLLFACIVNSLEYEKKLVKVRLSQNSGETIPV